MLLFLIGITLGGSPLWFALGAIALERGIVVTGLFLLTLVAGTGLVLLGAWLIALALPKH